MLGLIVGSLSMSTGSLVGSFNFIFLPNDSDDFGVHRARAAQLRAFVDALLEGGWKSEPHVGFVLA
jgi:hypothetical protein